MPPALAHSLGQATYSSIQSPRPVQAGALAGPPSDPLAFPFFRIERAKKKYHKYSDKGKNIDFSIPILYNRSSTILLPPSRRLSFHHFTYPTHPANHHPTSFPTPLPPSKNTLAVQPEWLGHRGMKYIKHRTEQNYTYISYIDQSYTFIYFNREFYL